MIGLFAADAEHGASAGFAFDATFFALVGLIIFFGIVIYLRLPSKIAALLDKRIDKVRDDLNQARLLREQAMELLAQAERRQRQAEAEAQAIVTNARQEAGRLLSEIRQGAEDQIARRAKMAEERIAREEAVVLANLRRVAADAASGGAEILLRDSLNAQRRVSLVDEAIADAATHLTI
ncbi:MAG TPA: ATP F0F1 synthase subunit B [Hyphomonadaceae bacterium]|nr:ATP F0F1 synthase subunit B [Hyphomonadaceae bacterium]